MYLRDVLASNHYLPSGMQFALTGWLIITIRFVQMEQKHNYCTNYEPHAHVLQAHQLSPQKPNVRGTFWKSVSLL